MNKHQSCLTDASTVSQDVCVGDKGNQFGIPSDISSLDLRRLQTPPYSISGILAPTENPSATEHHDAQQDADNDGDFANRFMGK